MPNAERFPISAVPGLSRLFRDFCAASPSVRSFFPWLPSDSWTMAQPAALADRPELARLLAAQNQSPSVAPALAALAHGAGVVVTGQQVGLFGGPLFTPFKAATALARARHASAQGRSHVAVFWLATEDHDFAEINHVLFPDRRELRKLAYSSTPGSACPVGGVLLDDSILPLVEQAEELLGPSDATGALAAAYRPGRTFAQAFAEFYSQVFAAQGLLVLDASSRPFHRMGAPVLRAALEQADELHSALLARNRELEAAGYHAQVAVTAQSSLLFLVDERTGARLALKRQPPSVAEPAGLWQTGRLSFTTADLLGILDAEPERISPSALLRPVFQDLLLSTSLTVGGPAEIAYFAQSAVLFERILGRVTPAAPRFSATLVEPAIADLLRRCNLTPDRIFAQTPASLAQLFATQAMPTEGRQKLDAANRAFESEMEPLLAWMHSLDAGLGRSAEAAASKMRYQMNRLRRLGANFQLQREASLGRRAQSICLAIYPQGALQERVLGAAYFFARYGFALAEELVAQAGHSAAGHTALWL